MSAKPSQSGWFLDPAAIPSSKSCAQGVTSLVLQTDVQRLASWIAIAESGIRDHCPFPRCGVSASGLAGSGWTNNGTDPVQPLLRLDVVLSCFSA